MEIEYKEEYKYFTRAILNVTDACNLACKYCFVEQHPHQMELQTAKQIIDTLVKNYKFKNKYYNFNDAISILFFGGEPLLAFESIIKPVIKYINENYNDIKFIYSITTNGTLLDNNKIDFLKNNNFSILLSIDGDKYTQDYNRPYRNGDSSFDKIIINIKYLLQQFPQVCFRSTIYQDTVDYMFENYLFAEKLGFRNYFCMPDHRSLWSEEKIKKLEQELEKIFIYRINQYLYNISPMQFTSINYAYLNILNHDLCELKVLQPPKRHYERCGLGTTEVSIGYDGKIYGCQEQPSKDKKNMFLIGDIDNGIDEDKHKNLINFYMNSDKLICSNKDYCQQCLLQDACVGLDCPSTSYDLFNNFYTTNYIKCKWKNILLKNAICAMKILTENKNELFYNFLIKNSKEYKKYFSNLEIFERDEK